METLNPLSHHPTNMNKLSTFKSLTITKPTTFFNNTKNIKTSFKYFCILSTKNPSTTIPTVPEKAVVILPEKKLVEKNLVEEKVRTRKSGNVLLLSKKDIAAQFKQNWLNSLSSPNIITNNNINFNGNNDIDNDGDINIGESLSGWVVGVDPDVSGAIAVLKRENGDFSAQVFDSPSVKVLIGNRSRRRLDAKSIVQLLRSFDAPVGTTAYVEQSTPYPKDGKLGWWSGGFGYGLWIGVLVSSGFSVVPVPSITWKNKFCLSGSRTSKDDSRELASTLFPNMCSLLKRKKDHGRAEALLIAAYGKGLNLSTNLSGISEDLTSQQKMD